MGKVSFFTTFRRITPPLSLFLLLSAGVVTACSDDNPQAIEVPAEPEFVQLGRYAYTLRDSQDSLSIRLDGISRPVERVESSWKWLSVTPSGMSEGGCPMLTLLRTGDTPEGFTADSAYIYFSDKERVTLVVDAANVIRPLSDNSAEEYKDFEKEWWKQNSILYQSTTLLNNIPQTQGIPIPLPWADVAVSNIPANLLVNRLPESEGWMMAYNFFASEVDVKVGQQTYSCAQSQPYFCLYNKYTGVLRVFYYQLENVGTGGEFSFLVTPEQDNTEKYPFYHNMQYALPVGNEGLYSRPNPVAGMAVNNTFQSYVTPFRRAGGQLQKGWYCFDLDMSAYHPSASTPFALHDRLSFEGRTNEKGTLSLAGTLTADIDGTMEWEASGSASTSTGLSYHNAFTSGTTNAGLAWDALLEGNYLMAAYKGAMTLWNFGNIFLGKRNDETVSQEKARGDINLSLTGKISMQGYLVTPTSNGVVNLTFSYTAYSASDSVVGRGVWSLQDNPVVYVVNDRLIGDPEDFVCSVESDKYGYGIDDPTEDHLRLMTFFDPTSLHFNLNTSRYKEIRNVQVSWTYGVYPNQQPGHTDPFRIGLLDLKNKGAMAEPVFVDKQYAGKVYKSYTSACEIANMDYVSYPLEEMTLLSLDNGQAAPQLYAQKGTDYRYYACPGTDLDAGSASFFLSDPVVCLPTTYQKKKDDKGKEEEYGEGFIYDFQAPDFVVGVVLTFEYTQDNGAPAQALFTKRFIPEVRGISTRQMLQKRNDLRKYVDSGVHQRIGDLEIRHGGAASLLKQFFATSEYIENYDME